MNLVDEIQQIAKQHLRGVKRVGSQNIAAICPFHLKQDGSPERSPSFSMSTTTGLWHCFSCHEAGNLRTFLKNVGVSAVLIEDQYHYIIEEAARAVPKRLDPLRPGVISEDPLPESLLGLFQYCPLDLLKDGFTEETLEHFDVGFDKEHMRITYPLRDISGQLFGISGRTVTDDLPRYKVYTKEYTRWGLPERSDGDTKKRASLWNADKVFPRSLHQEIDLVVVEGFKACMWLYQAQVPHVVALTGSYMSEEQQWILERIGGRIFLMFDNDDAGRKARRFVGKRLAKSHDVHVVLYGNYEDDTQPDRLSIEEVHESLLGAPAFYKWLEMNR